MKQMVLLSFIIFQISTTVQANNEVKADISFMIADLKVSESGVKILEFGDATWSGFKGFGYIYGRGAAWKRAWDHLRTYNLPIFFVGTASPQEQSIQTLQSTSSCRYLSNISNLKKDTLFKELLKQETPEVCKQISDYKGIVIFNRYRKSSANMAFQEEYPNFLVLNENIYLHAQYKHLTNKLFDNDYLKQFRPTFGVYERIYTPELTQNIMQEIDSPYYVLKPPYGSRGHGVLMVSSKDLNATLQEILSPEKKSITNHISKQEYEQTYARWEKSREDPRFRQFIVEQYVPSYKITVRQKPYDPTMRIFFFLDHNNNTPQIHFLGAYWKKPIKSLIDTGTFREKHLSYVPSMPPANDITMETIVSNEIFSQVKQQLKSPLIMLYKKILTQEAQKDVTEELRKWSTHRTTSPEEDSLDPDEQEPC